MRSSHPQRCFDFVQRCGATAYSASWPKNVARYRKHCTETDCEDATLHRQESTCGNLKKCPIFKHLVLVPGSTEESNGFRLRYCARASCARNTPKLVLDGVAPP